MRAVDVTLGELMSASVRTIAPDITLGEAARLMSDAPLSCLVVHWQGSLLGILTERDMVTQLHERTASSTLVSEIMTSPVITSRKIAMTAPVVSDAKSMSFVMPPGINRDDIPDPLDNRVRITTLPARDVAVIRFKGYATPEDVVAAEERLLEGLKNAALDPVGDPFLMRYNPPWTPGFLRRNEVAVEIRR